MPALAPPSMTSRAFRIRYYICALVAGCSLGGLLLSWGLSYGHEVIERESRELEARFGGSGERDKLRRDLREWMDLVLLAIRRPEVGPQALERAEEVRGQVLMLDERRFPDEVNTLLQCHDKVVTGLELALDPDLRETRASERLAEIETGMHALKGRIHEAIDGMGSRNEDELRDAGARLEARRAGMSWMTYAAGAGYVAFVILLWLWTERRLIRPLQHLNREASSPAVTEGAFELDPYGPLEVRQLTQSLSGLVTDLVSARDDLEERIRERTAELEESNRAKDEFLANMSHEIRTPMTAMLGYAELCREEGISADDLRRNLEIIRVNGDHLLNVINDILDVSRIEAGRMSVELIDASVFSIVSEVVILMKAWADEKELELSVQYTTELPSLVQTDPTRLRQILVNLIGNAIKFTDEGSIALQVFMESTEAGEFLVFEVRDTGMGMTDEELELVFEPFVQADTSMSRKHGGTGLGLPISRSLAQMLGGDLTCESKEGEGSLFRVIVDPGNTEGVPRVAAPASTEKTRPAEGAPHSPIEGRALVAEDVAVNRRLITIVLERLGLRIQAVENGRLALEGALEARASGDPFDIVFMDMQMPEMDGYEATRRLRAAGYDAPIVALTSHSMPEERQKCLDAGCDAFATKPIDRRAILTVIERFVRKTAA